MKAEKHIQKMFPSLYGTGSLFMRLFPYILSMIKTDNLYFRGNLLPPHPNGIDYKSIIYIKTSIYCVRRHSKHYPCPYAACAVSTHPQFKRNTLWPLNFSLAVGCLHTDYEKYEVIDGVRVRRGTETKNWWGPVNAGVTLVWKIY